MSTKTIFEGTVLHEGWEYDNKIWVEESPDGSIEVLTTSHGVKIKLTKAKLSEYIQITISSLTDLLVIQRNGEM